MLISKVMLATLCFWPLLGLPFAYAATINVIPSSDPSLVYSPGWTQEFSEATQNSYLQAEGFDCALSVTLPSNASSVSYVGFKRAGGSMYGYTLDCQEDCLLQTANGTDPTVTDEAAAPESTLFTLTLDPTTQHTLYVYNIPSSQSNGSSQINLNNLNVALEDSNGGNASFPATSSASSASVSGLSTSATLASPSSSVSAPSGSSNDGSTTPIDVGVSSNSATQTGPSASSVTGSTTPSIPVLPIASSASAGSANAGDNAGSSSNPGKSGGVSKSVAIGVSILAVVFGGGLIAALVVFIRQRRQKARNSYPGSSSGSQRSGSPSGSQPPPSPTGSILPIMPPPMRSASTTYYSPAIPNPFIDPPSGPASDNPYNNGSQVQRRTEGRTSPGSPASPAPNIPLPDIPRGGMDSRSNSPATAYARSDLWIARSPAKPSFSVL